MRAFLSCLLLLWPVVASGAQQPQWQPFPGGRKAPLSVPKEGKIGFQQIDPLASGIFFTNQLSLNRHITNQIYLNGSGVAAGDVDGDGWCDLYFCGLDNQNALFRNVGGWRFTNITDQAGIGCAHLASTGAAFADLDGDRDLDLIVNSVGGGTEIYSNNGAARFSRIATLNSHKGGMSIALADIDGDADLDLYVVNYRTTTLRDMPNTRLQGATVDGRMVVEKVNGRPATDPDLVGRFTLDPNGKISENGEADVLFRNDGGGKFTAVPFTSGTFLDEDGKPLSEPPYEWGLSAMFRDLNGDGAPDLYVCNDFHSVDRIWINDGQGRFRALARTAVRHTSMFSMGVDFADVNRDGFDDFFVADMLSRSHERRHTQVANVAPLALPIGRLDDRPQYSFNTLHLNRGDGTYAEVAQFSGIDASEWSWCPIFLDVDLDGYEDLLVTTGHERDALHMDYINQIESRKARERLGVLELLGLQKMIPRLDTPNLAFRNRGNLRFEDTSAAWGFNTPGVSHGMAAADLDNDGDLDLAVNNLNGPAGIYRNEATAPRLAIRLKGTQGNSRGIGAKIRVSGGGLSQAQEMICAGRYLSSDDALRVFAGLHSTNRFNLEVVWRNGKQSRVENAGVNFLYEIDEESSVAPSLSANQAKPKESEKLFFEDQSHLLNHTHYEEPYDDFLRQPLLPNRLSQLGPGVSWSDIDADGWEDLIVGSGRGGRLALFRNNSQGEFLGQANSPLDRPIARDQTTILAWNSILLAGAANYEDGLTNGGCIRIYDLQNNATGESILGQSFSRGPLAMADVDLDGNLDLFIGGRVIPGRYPEPATSLLLRNAGGRFTPMQQFSRLGLVTGAVFSDLDSDGRAELIVAREWDGLALFRQDQAEFKAWDPEVRFAEGASGKTTLSQLTGWWTGVTTGDFDGDGKLDIVAANWGLNSKYRASRTHPRRLYYGDINGAGQVDLIEAYVDSASGKEVPERVFKTVAAIFPFLQQGIGTYEKYSRTTLPEIYGDHLKKCARVEANTLASMVFLNRGDHFQAALLPDEAQFAPAFGVSVADFDGDGCEDIFLSQNFFSTSLESARADAGLGLWLRGDGRGGFSAVPARESGLYIYGEQRGCAVADYDGDGRADLAVSQNGAATKLYRNVRAKPGVRVMLRGGSGNPGGAGAVVRLIFENGPGPAREIHAGSGYWSQDGGVQVLPAAVPPRQLWVRWPGGRVTTLDFPAGAKSVEVSLDGGIKKLN